MNTALKEGNMVRCLEPVTADVVGERRSVPIQVGSTGAVVVVYAGSEGNEAYEIEFFLPDEDVYALATVAADKVEGVAM